MAPEQRFGSGSLAAAGAALLLAQAYHPIMLAALRAGEGASWLAVLVAGILTVALYWPAARLLAAVPGGNLIDLARRAAGGPGAIITGLLISGLLVYNSAFVLRETAEMTVSSVYPHTPQTFAMVALILCAAYGADAGLAPVVRLCRAILPVLVLSIAGILLGSFGWGEIRYLLPIWGPGPGALLVRSLGLTALYTPLLFLLVAAGQVADRQKLARAGAVAALVAAVLIAAAKVVLLMTFPLPLGLSVTFPLHALSRLVITGRFFERLDSLWLLAWAISTVCYLAALLHAAAAAFAGAFGLPSHRLAVLPLVTMALTVAIAPTDQSTALNWHAAAAPFGTGITFGLPLALGLVARWRQQPARHGA